MLKEYTFDIFYEPMEEGGYLVIVPALPGIVTYGKDLEEARLMALDAIRCHCEGLQKDKMSVRMNYETDTINRTCSRTM